MARWIIIALLLFPNIALGGVYVSGGVDPVEIGRRIAVSSPGVITLASGSVTRANTKISAVDGTAFVDFSTANVLTDYVPYKGKLTITDSAGKKLVGYIKAAGTGETYGPELITNGDMEDGDPPNNWLYVNSIRSRVEKDGGGYCLRTEATGGNSWAYQYVTLPVGASALTTFSAKKEGAWTVVVGLMRKFNSPAADLTGDAFVTGSWGSYSLNHTHVLGDVGVLFFVANNTGAVGFWGDVSSKQRLTPSLTGVTITSTPDGTTYNWESQESGFNYNDASGYTYAITTR